MTKLYYKTDEYGTIRWYKEGTNIVHREDGPAIEYANGDKYWCQNGKYHRVDGPAIESANGTKHWYQNGKFHREDGSAIINAYGYNVYYYKGIEYKNIFSDEEWKNLVFIMKVVE